jgi:hypothetical protein
MTLEEVATMLGADGVDWAIERLRRYASFVGSPIKQAYDDSFDRLAFEGAIHLEMWIRIEANAYDMIGEDYPDCMDHVGNALDEVTALIAQCIRQPGRRGGPTPDDRRHICAGICGSIWQEVHPSAGLNSDTLLEACEAYWQASGQPPRLNGAECRGERGWESDNCLAQTQSERLRGPDV